jgi:hypothetical protein
MGKEKQDGSRLSSFRVTGPGLRKGHQMHHIGHVNTSSLDARYRRPRSFGRGVWRVRLDWVISGYQRTGFIVCSHSLESRAWRADA